MWPRALINNAEKNKKTRNLKQLLVAWSFLDNDHWMKINHFCVLHNILHTPI